MRKNVFGRQFSRDTNERQALFKNLMSSLVLQERIQTTVEKAKAIRPEIERIVTKAKKTPLQNSYNILHPYLNKDALRKLIRDVAPRFATRPGGYTRIIKIGNRLNDNAAMAIIEWVEKGTALVPIAKTASIKSERKSVKELKSGLKSQEEVAKKKTTRKTTKRTTKPKEAKTK